MATTFARIQVLFGTTAEWAANSTFVGLAGEIMVNTETGQIKVGNGAATYAALPFTGEGLGVNFATSAEVLAGLLTNVAVAPDTLLANYPQKAAGALAQSVSTDWSFNAGVTLAGRTTVTLQPRTDGTGVNDAMPRSYIDSLFSGQVSSGPGDANKAPILNSSGQLDTSFIPSANLPSFRGLFDPVLGLPGLQDVLGGGVTPAAISGDYFIASDTGFYNFTLGTPGSGTEVFEGAQVIFNALTNQWSVVNPQGTSFDPGAVRLAPTNSSESTITPTSTTFPNLTLRQFASQTANMLSFLDSGGGQLAAFDIGGTLTSTSVIVTLTAPGLSSDLTSYPSGLSFSAVTLLNGWPDDGAVNTYKISDTEAFQMFSNQNKVFVRRFTSGAWTAFSQLAPAENPSFSGNVSVPTVPEGTDNDQAASSEFVVTAIQDPSTTQVRLSTAIFVPINASADVSTDTLYINPYEGNAISLYVPGRPGWVTRRLTAPITISPLGLASTIYDVFAYWSGTEVLAETLAWANDTTRATALTLQDGVYVQLGNATRKYLGSYRLNTSSEIATKVSAIRDLAVAGEASWPWLLYNHYNQIDLAINMKLNNGANQSTSFSNSTWAGITGGPAFFLLGGGLNKYPCRLTHKATIQNPALAASDGRISWGLNAPTTVPSGLLGNSIATFAGAGSNLKTATVDANALFEMPAGLAAFYPTVLAFGGAPFNYLWQQGNDFSGSNAIAQIRA